MAHLCQCFEWNMYKTFPYTQSSWCFFFINVIQLANAVTIKPQVERSTMTCLATMPKAFSKIYASYCLKYMAWNDTILLARIFNMCCVSWAVSRNQCVSYCREQENANQ
jgi:hypothetical protein